MAAARPPSYLAPYLQAAAEHGAQFPSLLWASPQTQAARFRAFTRLCDLSGRSLLDAGCGRADLLDFLLAQGIRPESYVGIEAVGELAAAAEAKGHPHCTILRGDFVKDPLRLFAGADVVLFSGSLNTLDSQTFHRILPIAFEATAEVLLLNFLASPMLAATDYLTWHDPADVLAFARRLTPHVRMLDDYLAGDCTLALEKAD